MKYGSQFTDETRQAIRNKYRGRCSYCGDTLPDRWHVDHRWPKALDGSNDMDNLMPSCRSCNSLKSDYEPEMFRAIVAWRNTWNRLVLHNGLSGSVPKFPSQLQLIVLQKLLGKHLVDIISDDPAWKFYYETADEQVASR